MNRVWEVLSWLREISFPVLAIYSMPLCRKNPIKRLKDFSIWIQCRQNGIMPFMASWCILSGIIACAFLWKIMFAYINCIFMITLQKTFIHKPKHVYRSLENLFCLCCTTVTFSRSCFFPQTQMISPDKITKTKNWQLLRFCLLLLLHGQLVL